MNYPAVLVVQRVGTCPATAKSGGGYVRDEVLEYRVWCHPERGAPEFASAGPGADAPLAILRGLA